VTKGEGFHLQCSDAVQSTCSYHSRRPAHKKVNPRPLTHSTAPTPGKLIEFLARCNITSAEERTHHTHISALCVRPANAGDTLALYIYIYIYSRRVARTSGSIVRHNNNQLFTIHRVRARTPDPPPPPLPSLPIYTLVASEAQLPDPILPVLSDPVQSSAVCRPTPTGRD